MIRTSRVVGLVGGVGSGKSEVASIFRRLGARVIRADEVARRAAQHPDVLETLARWWGPGVAKRGRLDRVAVANIVFRDPAQLGRLNRLVHPRVRRELRREVDEARRRGGVLVMEVPLLQETGLDRWCDAVVFVHAPRAAREERVRRSRSWTAAELARRTRAQWPLRRKRAGADFVIDNGGPRAATVDQVRTVWRTLRGAAR